MFKIFSSGDSEDNLPMNVSTSFLPASSFIEPALSLSSSMLLMLKPGTFNSLRRKSLNRVKTLLKTVFNSISPSVILKPYHHDFSFDISTWSSMLGRSLNIN